MIGDTLSIKIEVNDDSSEGEAILRWLRGVTAALLDPQHSIHRLAPKLPPNERADEYPVYTEFLNSTIYSSVNSNLQIPIHYAKRCSTC